MKYNIIYFITPGFIITLFKYNFFFFTIKGLSLAPYLPSRKCVIAF